MSKNRSKRRKRRFQQIPPRRPLPIYPQSHPPSQPDLRRRVPRRRRVLVPTVLVFGLLGLVAYIFYGVDLSPEEQLAKERALLEEEKRAIEQEHARALAEAQERVRAEAARQKREAEEAEERRAQEIKDARTRIEIAKVQAERAKLRKQPIPQEIADQITQADKKLEELLRAPTSTTQGSEELAQANAELARLKAKGVDYSKLSEPQMNITTSTKPSLPKSSNDDQTRLILSALWLGACFFLQRVFEKLFKDRGYALLTVCAAGFLIAFLTANYFLLGGSVTGGLMGSVGERS